MKRHDNHPWHELKIINIKDGDGSAFKHSLCVGHVFCQNL